MPTALLWDLSLGNVELLATSPLPPPTLEGVHLQPPVPGTSPSGVYLLRSLYTQDLISIRPIQSHVDVLASTTPPTQRY
ncbi:hypothetical protein F5051DRAFT_444357 [Lentinula edodes]|nr:hypothetical protein F5051DRAFT_444357 [Lentinula edodes]